MLALLRLARFLPAGPVMRATERAGRLLAPILPRSALARSNMAKAFPDAPPERIDGWVRGVWGSTMRLVAEFVYLDRLAVVDEEVADAAAEDVPPGTVVLRGAERVRTIRDGGRPTIFVTAHSGNWEILPRVAAARGLATSALFRPLNNPYLAEHLVRARGATNADAPIDLISSDRGAARLLSRVLERDGAVGLLADQWFGRGVRVRFLGRSTRANPLAAKLARRFEADLVPARCVRLPGGGFRLDVEPPLQPPRDGEGRIDVPATTQLIADRIGAWVAEHPDQWLWLHRRWK